MTMSNTEGDVLREAHRIAPINAYLNEEIRHEIERRMFAATAEDIFSQAKPGDWYTFQYRSGWRRAMGPYNDPMMEFTLSYRLNYTRIEKLVAYVPPTYAAMPAADLAFTAVDEICRRLRQRFTWWRRYTLPKRLNAFLREAFPWHFESQLDSAMIESRKRAAAQRSEKESKA